MSLQGGELNLDDVEDAYDEGYQDGWNDAGGSPVVDDEEDD